MKRGRMVRVVVGRRRNRIIGIVMMCIVTLELLILVVGFNVILKFYCRITIIHEYIK